MLIVIPYAIFEKLSHRNHKSLKNRWYLINSKNFITGLLNPTKISRCKVWKIKMYNKLDIPHRITSWSLINNNKKL